MVGKWEGRQKEGRDEWMEVPEVSEQPNISMMTYECLTPMM